MKLFYSVWIILLLFILGIYMTMTYTSYELTHTYNNSCPNMLVQVGSIIWLYNSNNPIIEGVNPIKFNNMEEYYEFVKWQKQVGLDCPVLYVQQVFNTQGEAEYHLRNTPLQPFNENKMIIESLTTTKNIEEPKKQNGYLDGIHSSFIKNSTKI